MIINETVLLENGANYEDFAAKQTIFTMGNQPNYYLQIVSGIVELNNYHDDGKEFTLNILSDGEAINESLLFSENSEPVNAVARTDCKVLRLSKPNFMKMVRENYEILYDMLRCLSNRILYKNFMLFNNSSADPTAKIQALLDYHKKMSMKKDSYGFYVSLTRQQIANLTGLRVETVIRTIKKMEKANVLKIENRKVFY
ncbi:Crp/Fnr family transcriptional regulator [Chryseobacterium sp. OSA05B]|uniref:Crp/Fnr family transcriptional regulator n=1 Tax=Chryseobacterium sp. OSA05B TaxID=2862650 RepID=UPI001CC0E2F9|nr:Crp/Fnr family transcriptional regulator [Chryseobacterium sp. OSA05B]